MNQMQEYYLKNRDLREDDNRFKEQRVRWAVKVLMTTGWLLDAACNDAFLHALRPGQNYIGLELNLYALRVALEKYRQDSHLNLVQASVEYMPIRANSIQSVFAGEILEHLEEPISFIQNIRHVLYSSILGVAVITTPVPGKAGGHHPGNPQHVYEYGITELFTLLDNEYLPAQGWEVCRVYGDRLTYVLIAQKRELE